MRYRILRAPDRQLTDRAQFSIKLYSPSNTLPPLPAILYSLYYSKESKIVRIEIRTRGYSGLREMPASKVSQDTIEHQEYKMSAHDDIKNEYKQKLMNRRKYLTEKIAQTYAVMRKNPSSEYIERAKAMIEERAQIKTQLRAMGHNHGGPIRKFSSVYGYSTTLMNEYRAKYPPLVPHNTSNQPGETKYYYVHEGEISEAYPSLKQALAGRMESVLKKWANNK